MIALSCIIFSAISSSPPAVDTSASVVTAVWTYVGELALNLLVLVGAIKGCDRIVKEWDCKQKRRTIMVRTIFDDRESIPANPPTLHDHLQFAK